MSRTLDPAAGQPVTQDSSTPQLQDPNELEETPSAEMANKNKIYVKYIFQHGYTITTVCSNEKSALIGVRREK